MNTLIVSHDPPVIACLEATVEGPHQTAPTIAEAIVTLHCYDFAIALIDCPTMGEILEVRRVSKVPIIALTRQMRIRVVELLGAGCDDVMEHPFHPTELAVRMTAVVRRTANSATSQIDLGSVVIDLDKKAVFVNGRHIHLRPKHYHMLELLAMRRGRVINRQTMMDHLYGGRDEPEEKIIDIFICGLRKTLRDAGAPDIVETRWARGWVIEEHRSNVFAPPSELSDAEGGAMNAAAGQRYGRLTLIAPGPTLINRKELSKIRSWIVDCDCGKRLVVRAGNLGRRSNSCGCWRIKKARSTPRREDGRFVCDT